MTTAGKLDVIIPSELEADELFRRNGEYVPRAAYDRLRIALGHIANDRIAQGMPPAMFARLILEKDESR